MRIVLAIGAVVVLLMTVRYVALVTGEAEASEKSALWPVLLTTWIGLWVVLASLVMYRLTRTVTAIWRRKQRRSTARKTESWSDERSPRSERSILRSGARAVWVRGALSILPTTHQTIDPRPHRPVKRDNLVLVNEIERRWGEHGRGDVGYDSPERGVQG